MPKTTMLAAALLFALVSDPDGFAPPDVHRFRLQYGGTVSLYRTSEALTFMEVPLGGGFVWQMGLERTTGPIGTVGAVTQLRRNQVGAVMSSINQDSPNFVYRQTQPGKWGAVSRRFLSPLAYGGDYRFSQLPGDAVDISIPEGTTILGLNTMTAPNGGFMIVRLNGGSLGLDRLKTAQDYANLGLLPSTALTSNGGTLDPSEKLLDLYTRGTIWDAHVLLTDELPPGSTTLTLEATGIARAEATGQRSYVSGLSTGRPGAKPGDPATSVWEVDLLNNYKSAYEPVFATQLLGYPSRHFIGKSHGNEDERKTEVFAGDSPVPLPAVGERILGSSFRIVVSSWLFYPDGQDEIVVEGPPGSVGRVTTTYEVSNLGVRVHSTTTYTRDCHLGTGYAAMMPLESDHFQTGAVNALATDLDLAPDDGLAMGKKKADVAVAWGGKYAAAVYVPDIAAATDDWTRAGPLYTWIQRRVNGVRKIYVTRIVSSALGMWVGPGTTMESESFLLVGRFTDPAASFSRTAPP